MTDTDDAGFQGEHFEGMGNVWSAMFGEAADITSLLPAVIQEGVLKDGAAVNHAGIERGVLLHEYPEFGPIRAGALSVVMKEEKNIELWSAYPILEGASNSIIIDGRHTWENGIEGTVAAYIDSGPPVAFFDPYYYRESDRFVKGVVVQVDLAGLAFSLAKADAKDIAVTKGEFYDMELNRFLTENSEKKASDFKPPIVTMRGARILLSSTYVPEYTFQCPVLNVEECTFFGTRFFRIQTVFAGRDESELRGFIYASEAILNGYEPKRGDDVSGILWMSGHITTHSDAE